MSQLQMQFLPKNNKTRTALSSLQSPQSQPQFVLSTPQPRPRTTTTSPFSLYSSKGLNRMISDFSSLPKGCKSCGH